MNWSTHNQNTKLMDLPISNTLRYALNWLEEEGNSVGHAIDLGAGSGVDSFGLLEKGWKVTAVDFDANALDLIQKKVEEYGGIDRLNCYSTSFEEMVLPASDLINASFSLPFCKPEAFERVWSIIYASLRSRGVFCGHFFGKEDSWFPNENMIFHDGKDIGRCFEKFDILKIQEINRIGKTLGGKEKHWHVFHIAAVKR
ncbi:class I SAM-dependent methyltransferase [Aureibacter tunicatorum]|uniref:SAM-dependent methyltransferase n=1 Tax=Aureibacter tunicatorum TaxID=866807 RepID=A0AAE4BVT5_9BACT|nr:class I SAM-dependent methyltransferase [Aureibacter tunicatorum]MDR6242023.1 SAM-dependent methyltransferase [Aureibacter tunicatorum]BDD07132.1 SAM-dependent methyltransferase [Aureibacter tunicatorum]